MAHLTQQEFTQAIDLLATDAGLQRLRDKFVRLNALVTRRRAASVQHLADQLYMLTSGLRRQVPATVAFHSLWGERLNEKIGGEEGEKALEPLADKINGCLGERERLIPEKESELEAALRAYEGTLSAKVGAETARLDMLLKSVPDVAKKLREMPPAPPATAAEEEPADKESAETAAAEAAPPAEGKKKATKTAKPKRKKASPGAAE